MVDAHAAVASEDAALQVLLLNPGRHGNLVLFDLLRVKLIFGVDDLLTKRSFYLTIDDALQVTEFVLSIRAGIVLQRARA